MSWWPGVFPRDKCILFCWELRIQSWISLSSEQNVSVTSPVSLTACTHQFPLCSVTSGQENTPKLRDNKAPSEFLRNKVYSSGARGLWQRLWGLIASFSYSGTVAKPRVSWNLTLEKLSNNVILCHIPYRWQSRVGQMVEKVKSTLWICNPCGPCILWDAERRYLYLRFLWDKSIIPIKAIPERKPVFSRASQWFGDLCPNLQSFLFSCFMVSFYKASHKMGLGTLWAKNNAVLWDAPEVSQNETTGVLRMLTRPWEL